MKRLAVSCAGLLFSICSSFAATPPTNQKVQPAPPPGMVLIPGGTFMMGCTEEKAECEDIELPVHEVRIPSYFFDITEVTVEAFEDCLEAGRCGDAITAFDYDGCNLDPGGNSENGDYPINCITWQQARDFCRWVGKRLPSEPEWEYAARGGHKDWKYPWGDKEADCSMAILCQIQIMEPQREKCSSKITMGGCGRQRTWPVKSRLPNDYGLYDMIGNVEEWIQDCWHGDYKKAPSNGKAWTTGDCEVRIRRGGAWDCREQRISVFSRAAEDTNGIRPEIGFRCAKSIE